ncbi:MAG: RAD52 family DNA repair protein, partial [Pyrinomonadaceae bacterium]|nr:RAD52 family DNA repair protein [Pyrinomonadaceae bacterium]
EFFNEVISKMTTQATTELETTENQLTELPDNLRSIRDIVKDLSKPIAQKHLRKRRQGGKEITYLSWHDAVKYLDHFAPGWCYEIRSIESVAGKLIMIVRLSVSCAEGSVYREATGQEDEDLESYGNSSSNAESMALRRAAAKFGLGLSLYDQNK